MVDFKRLSCHREVGVLVWQNVGISLHSDARSLVRGSPSEGQHSSGVESKAVSLHISGVGYFFPVFFALATFRSSLKVPLYQLCISATRAGLQQGSHFITSYCWVPKDRIAEKIGRSK